MPKPTETTTCAYEDCEKEATDLACGRGERGHPKPKMYCHAHADKVSDEECPEYIVICPNCNCQFGVN